MPTIEVDFSVYCSKCGNGLCRETEVDNRKMTISVEPCSKCLEKKYDAGYEKGYDTGSSDGYQEAMVKNQGE